VHSVVSDRLTDRTLTVFAQSWWDCQSHLAGSQETWVRNFAYGHYWFYSCRKSTTWDRFLSPLKIHRPRSGSNPRTLGPVASTLTTSPPRATYDLSTLWNITTVSCSRFGVYVSVSRLV
jgi:hypothetical protein